jgi:sugar O-acyltransferase (sialic acid O-acetyltransferase NeuD family)
MKTLYLCGAGNPEGARLALAVNKAHKRWDRIIILDDDPSKHGISILGIEIKGPFSLLADADPVTDEVSNMVAGSTRARKSALEKIRTYNLPIAKLIDPGVDIFGVELGNDVTIHKNATLCANASIEDDSVVLMTALIGHASHIGRNCIIAPGAVINARVKVDEGVYVGTNASVLPDLRIGAWATIGANSAVIEDVPAGATAMGVPAQIIIVPRKNPTTETSQPSTGLSRKNQQSSLPPSGTTEKTNREADPLMQLRKAQLEFIESHKRH